MDTTPNPELPENLNEHKTLEPLALAACATAGVIGFGSAAAVIAGLISIAHSTPSGGYGA